MTYIAPVQTSSDAVIMDELVDTQARLASPNPWPSTSFTTFGVFFQSTTSTLQLHLPQIVDTTMAQEILSTTSGLCSSLVDDPTLVSSVDSISVLMTRSSTNTFSWGTFLQGFGKQLALIVRLIPKLRYFEWMILDPADFTGGEKIVLHRDAVNTSGSLSIQGLWCPSSLSSFQTVLGHFDIRRLRLDITPLGHVHPDFGPHVLFKTLESLPGLEELVLDGHGPKLSQWSPVSG